MPTFDEPQSRNEAILQNMLGAENELPEPQSRIEELLQEILEQGTGGTTPEGIVTATGQMTEQQKSDTLGNIGGESKKLVVTVTESGGVYSADKTFAEIEAAFDGGKIVIAKCGTSELQILNIDSGEEEGEFYGIEQNSVKPDVVIIKTLIVNADDEWVYTYQNYKCSPHIFNNTAPTSITLASAADNTIYEYGELSALTVTAIDTMGDFIIRFTSGATATTTNFPASMKFAEAFAAEASTRYEISVSNGYALVASWPVS